MNRKHGHNTSTGRSLEYRSWDQMIQRCSNPKNNRYSSYGGRGIRVCERWLMFENFLEDMGTKPNYNFTLERLEVDKDYEPDNCVWATQKEQQRNRRNNRMIIINGVTRTMAEWSEISGVNYSTLFTRLSRGWTPERAITT